MEKLEADATLITQEDYDEIEAISDNIMGFLDENPDIDRKSFMMGFTIANMNAVLEIMKTTAEELQYENNSTLTKLSENEEATNDCVLENDENPWPFKKK